MPRGIPALLDALASNPGGVRFADLLRICNHFFGKARIHGSHYVFKTSWPGDPRVNIQKEGSKAKAYQVRQVLRAIEKLQGGAK